MEKNTPNCGNYGTFHKFVDLWDIAYAYYIGHEKPTHIFKKKKILPPQLQIITSFPREIKWITTKGRNKNSPTHPPGEGGTLTLCFFLSTLLVPPPPSPNVLIGLRDKAYKKKKKKKEVHSHLTPPPSQDYYYKPRHIGTWQAKNGLSKLSQLSHLTNRLELLFHSFKMN